MPHKKGVFDIAFESPVPLIKNNVYHIVIKPIEDLADDDPIRVLMFRFNEKARPLNDENLDEPAIDEFMNVLFYDDENWTVLDHWPIFTIVYSDGFVDGQPYTLAAPWVTRGFIYWGQTIIPQKDYEIEKIAFVITKRGEPEDHLYYEIRNEQNDILSEGIFTTTNELRGTPKWVEITINETILFEKDKIYRIVFNSPLTKSDNSYTIFGLEFSMNKEIGYGGLEHRLTASRDNGTTWAAWNDADFIFRLTTAK